MYYLMKYEDSQQYGGPEEGGWWYNLANPQWKRGVPLPMPENMAYRICRWLNNRINERHNRKQEYGYTSVLSYRSEFFSFGLEDQLVPAYPHRPHYE